MSRNVDDASKRKRRTDDVLKSYDSCAVGSELIECMSRFGTDLPRLHLEPAPLSLDATSDDIACPLCLRIAAPHGLLAEEADFDDHYSPGTILISSFVWLFDCRWSTIAVGPTPMAVLQSNASSET